MRKLSLLLIVLVALSFFLYPQEYKGKGRQIGYVFDEQGAPLEGVTVKLFSLKVQQGFETKTDKEGKWVAFGIVGGGWNVDFEKFGFMPKKIAIQVNEWQRNPEVRLNLNKAEGLVVTEELKAMLSKGNELFDARKYDEAAAAFQEILAKFPDAFIINKNIGNCYFAQEKYDEAESSYQKILEKDPGSGEAILLIGNCYANRGQTEKALEWYGKIDFNKIDDPVVLYNVGTSYYNNSKFEEALKYYGKAVELQKDFTDGLYQLGLTYLAMNNQTEAIATFENYLKVDPDSTRAGQVKGFLEYLKKSPVVC
jgi:tetratricopeptide (TPR) repeat protein